MALADKVEELQRIVAGLVERVDGILRAINELSAARKEIIHELAEIRREHDKKIALLEREIDHLKKERDERSRRAWAFGPNVVGAVLSGAIAAAVAYFISRR